MNRREFLKGAAALVAGAVLPAIAADKSTITCTPWAEDLPHWVPVSDYKGMCYISIWHSDGEIHHRWIHPTEFFETAGELPSSN